MLWVLMSPGPEASGQPAGREKGFISQNLLPSDILGKLCGSVFSAVKSTHSVAMLTCSSQQQKSDTDLRQVANQSLNGEKMS
ncbi:hypothetical protein RRG08_056577 [Elysia crispata]|uniref:Uncharacterized protein n=1 Tax=Elysia crispata TaxID=231223 RepID=A0AAE1DSY4_9GAST|nr:hypothetical protein RRG08_056577 [Elysia crispata]